MFAYSLGNELCGAGLSTLTASLSIHEVRSVRGTEWVPLGILEEPTVLTGTQEAALGSCKRACSAVPCGLPSLAARMQEASPGTFHRCAAACNLLDECTAFSLTSESTGGACTLHGVLHDGLIAHLREFALDPRRDGTEEVRA